MTKHFIPAVRHAALLAAVAVAAACATRAGAASDVNVVANLQYYDGPQAEAIRHRLDLYLPRERRRFPVLMFVYGGDWASGSKDVPAYARLGRTFAHQGVGTAIINYRLSPAVRHPAHAQDVARAFAWLHAHIGEYGGRPDHLFLAGHSDGGHLVSLIATDPTYLRAVGLSPLDITGVASISGVYTIVPGFALYRPAFGSDPEQCRDASPISHAAGRHPPFLILYGDRDVRPMRDDADRMARALRNGGTEVDVRAIRAHGHIQMITSVGAAGDPVTQAILDFVMRH